MDNNYKQTNTMAIGALVCGILAVVLSLFSNIYTCILALVLGIAGIVLGAMGMKAAKATGTGHGLAVGGLVCGIIGTVFAVAMLACVATVLCAYGEFLGGLASLA